MRSLALHDEVEEGMKKEAKARILINDLLRRSCWRFFDDENGPANIALEANVKLKKNTLDALGKNPENK
jgi:type I restriction enzyme, R subunit